MIRADIIENGKQYAFCNYDQMPRKDDVIQVGDKPYLVRLVVWADPDSNMRSQLHVEFFTGQK